MNIQSQLLHQPRREQEALREIGRTEIAPFSATILVTLFLATIAAIPLLQSTLSESSGATEVALAVPAETARGFRSDGVFAANRVLLEGIERFETALEEESPLRRWLLPPTQRLLTDVLGVGNEQVYLGRAGWLFLRDDFDHITGPGFLDPRHLRNEERASDRNANPLPAILAFHRDLEARGIQLVVMPTPVKPTVYPEFLSRSWDESWAEIPTDASEFSGPVHNRSFSEFLDRLRAAGVVVFDPSTIFATAKSQDQQPLYLQTDTHWSPWAMRLAARGLADEIASRADWKKAPAEPQLERPATVAGPGDLARLLENPNGGNSFSSETTQISRVFTRRGQTWAPDRGAEVLLLGDSFSNIYSDPSLGWGTGAGLAEHLSLALGRSVDRIALNAGGAWSSRQALARGVTTSTEADRLEGKLVVVYQFAARELSIGNWKLLTLPQSQPD